MDGSILHNTLVSNLRYNLFEHDVAGDERDAKKQKKDIVIIVNVTTCIYTHSHQIDTGNVASSFTDGSSVSVFVHSPGSDVTENSNSARILSRFKINDPEKRKHFTQNSFIRSASGDCFTVVW